MSQPELTFKEMTYNGVSIIRELNTEYINATKLCKANGKRYRDLKTTKHFLDYLEIAKNHLKTPSPEVRGFSGGPINKLEFDVNTGPNEFRGTYIHPKLIHFVAEWCDYDYAFKVAELMDTINDSVHQRLNDLKLTDTPQNANTVFNLIIDEQKDRLVSNTENQQCWGIRETDKFDYLDSWNKDNIKRLFNQFKQDLIKQVDISFEELKRDYPQLIE